MKNLILTIFLINSVYILSQNDTLNYFDTTTRWNVGIHGGYNIDFLSSKLGLSNIINNGASFEFGTEVNYRMNKYLSINIGASYDKNTPFESECQSCYIDIENNAIIEKSHQIIDYSTTQIHFSQIKIPLGIRYNFNEDINNSFSIASGININILGINKFQAYSFESDTIFTDYVTNFRLPEKEGSSLSSYHYKTGYYLSIARSFSISKKINMEAQINFQYIPRYFIYKNTNHSSFGFKLLVYF